MLRKVSETVLAAGVSFVSTLGPLWEGGVTPQEWTACAVAALVSALALIRQQPPVARKG